MSTTPRQTSSDSAKPKDASVLEELSDPPAGSGRQRVMGVLERFSKQTSASSQVLALGLIKRAFGDAIEYSATFTSLRGMALFFGLLAAGVAFFGTWSGISEIGHMDLVVQIMGVLISAVFAIVGAWALLVTGRMELFAPSDQPIIFDRKSRRVYHMHQQQKSGLTGLFKAWPLTVSTYEWHLVDAQHVAQVAVNTATVTRRHQLRFLVRRGADDPTVVAMFQIGTAQLMGGPTVPMVWEHIRRYMEEHGPAVPPGEGTLSEIGPLTWRETYLSWWRMFTFPMLLMHAIFPISIALVLVVTFLNWLTRITAVPAVWPQDVQDAIGEPISVMQAS